MTAPEITRAAVWEGSGGHSLMARVYGEDNAAILQADVTSIAYSIRAKHALATVVDSGSLTKTSVVFDTLQTDARWTADAVGYNFRTTISATQIPNPGVYRVEIEFTMSDASILYLDPFELTVNEIYMT